MKDFNYEIVERIAVLGQKDGGRKTLELNRISYNGRPARFDLFDSLPLLQPWAWKFITAMAAAAGFAVGVSLALWAGFTLSV